LGIAGKKLKTTKGVLKNEKCLPPPRLLCFLKHPPTALCPVMCLATTREKSGHIFMISEITMLHVVLLLCFTHLLA